MKNRYLLWFIVLAVVLGNLIPVFIPTAEADHHNTPEPYHYITQPNNNNFGMSELKVVNFSFFRNLFRNNFDWLLEYNTGSGWLNGNQYLHINITWVNDSINLSGYWKFVLGFNKPQTQNPIDARFTFALNRNVLSYVHKVAQYTYLLNYSIPNTNETYYCMFNFSDMMNIPNLIFTHGIQNNQFWFRFRRNNIPSGPGYYEYDPIFGYDIGSGTHSLDTNNVYGCTWGIVTDDGVIDNITCRLAGVHAGDIAKFVIYDALLNLYYESRELTVDGGDLVAGWCTYELESTVYVTANELYYVGCISQQGQHVQIRLAVGTPANATRGGYLRESMDYDALEDPIGGGWDLNSSGSVTLAYASYTKNVSAPADTDPPIISAENPSNGSTAVTPAGFNVNLVWNCTIRDNNTFTWYINCSYTGETNTGAGDTNGSKNLTIEDVEYLYLFIIWVNASDSEGNSVSEFFNFTADNVSCPAVNGTVVDNTSEDWLWISDLSFGSGVLGLIVLSIFFYFAERKEDYALYILTFVIAMGTMYYYFGQGTIYSVEWFTGLALLLFGMYSLYLSIYYGMKNAGGRKV